jgi:uncharacterized protein YdaU (DUF1376 family)
MSQRNVPEWMPLYVYEFLADRNVQAMALDELGAYFLLIMTQWVNGSIPADLRVLGRLLRNQDAETTERIWMALKPCYRDHPELAGELIQGRVEEERETALTRLAGNSLGGRNSADRRQKTKSRPQVELGATTNTPVSQPQAERKLTGGGERRGMVVENCGVTPALKAAFDLVASRYPQCTGVDMAFQLWMGYCESGLLTEANAHEVDEGLTRYLESEKWARDDGRYIESFDKWIGGKKWRDRPNPSAEARANRRVVKRSSDGSDPTAEWVAPWAKSDDSKD